VTAAELARGIYPLQRRTLVRARRRSDDGPVPTWEQLDPRQRTRRVQQAARLARVYETARSNAAESRI
jgi:hypothetical protein